MGKRIFSVYLALALLTQTALAAELTLTGEVAVPPEAALMAAGPLVSVQVPAEGWVIVNPYGMDVVRDDVFSQEEVVSPVLTLENWSDFPVRIDAQTVGRVPAGSGVQFVEAPPAPYAAEKELFLYAEFQTVPEEFDDEIPWLGRFVDAPNQLMVTSDEQTKSGVLALGPAGSPYSTGAMHVFGSLAVQPEEPWMETDVFKVNIVFTFAALDGDLPISDVIPGEDDAYSPLPADSAEDEWGEPDFGVQRPVAGAPDADSVGPEDFEKPESPGKPGDFEEPGSSEEPENHEETEPTMDPAFTDENN